MFRQLKSAIIWTYIYRYRAFLLKVLVLLILAGIVEFIYRDMVEYLQLAKKVAYLSYLLAMKWALFLLALLYLVWSWKRLAKRSDKKLKKSVSVQKEKNRKLSKKEISSLAQQIIEQKRVQKG